MTNELKQAIMTEELKQAIKQDWFLMKLIKKCPMEIK